MRAAAVEADLADPDGPSSIASELDRLGLGVDYLVNNAGSAGPDLLEDREWEEQAAYLRLMMTSVARMCHLFVPGMRERGFGRILNVASVAGRIRARTISTTVRARRT